jgi:hypothetical protein
MKPIRILVLAHEDLLPPESMEGFTEEEILEWKIRIRRTYDSAEVWAMTHRSLVCSDDLGVIQVTNWLPSSRILPLICWKSFTVSRRSTVMLSAI